MHRAAPDVVPILQSGDAAVGVEVGGAQQQSREGGEEEGGGERDEPDQQRRFERALRPAEECDDDRGGDN